LSGTRKYGSVDEDTTKPTIVVPKDLDRQQLRTRCAARKWRRLDGPGMGLLKSAPRPRAGLLIVECSGAIACDPFPPIYQG